MLLYNPHIAPTYELELEQGQEHKDLGCTIIDTHPRDGIFEQQVEKEKDRISQLAKGRQINWHDDPNGEWTSVVIFFGTQHEIMARLCSIIKLCTPPHKGA